MSFAPVPIAYRKSSPVIFSFDAVDFATGVGLKTFYGGKYGTNYVLTPNTFYSESYSYLGTNNHTTKITKEATGGNSTWDTAITANFSVKFVKRAELGGNAVLNVPYCGFNVTEASTSYLRIVATLTKGATGTETAIVAVTSPSSPTLATTRLLSFMSAIKLVIPEGTVINKNEILNLKIEVQYASAGATCNIELAHDPKNRQPKTDAGTSTGWGTGDPTILTIELPFKVDV